MIRSLGQDYVTQRAWRSLPVPGRALYIATMTLVWVCFPSTAALSLDDGVGVARDPHPIGMGTYISNPINKREGDPVSAK